MKYFTKPLLQKLGKLWCYELRPRPKNLPKSQVPVAKAIRSYAQYTAGQTVEIWNERVLGEKFLLILHTGGQFCYRRIRFNFHGTKYAVTMGAAGFPE